MYSKQADKAVMRHSLCANVSLGNWSCQLYNE